MRKIDFHCHAFPAEFLQVMHQIYPDAIELREGVDGRNYWIWANTPLPVWDAEVRAKQIDQAGIDT